MPAQDWRYRPALDGLRAVAVAAVVLFHAWPATFGGGFVGVDLFFVLSGYLITGLLLVEHAGTGRVDLRAFWGRRVRRLMPAVLVLVATVSVVTAAIGTTSARSLADAWGALTWSTNWVELGLADRTWWASDLRTVLDHLWSLAVEEQFYVVWPLLAGALLLGRSRRRQVVVVGGLIVVSAALSGWEGYPHAYFRTDARAFELLAGVALAVSGWRPGRRAASVLVGLGLVATIAFVAMGDPTASALYPWGLLGVSAVAVAMVAGGLELDGPLGALLTASPVRAVGRVSYGIYLWHIPVIRVLSADRVGLASPWLHLVRLVVLAALVTASYRWIEQPLRRPGGPPLVWAVLGVVALLSTGLMVPGARRAVAARWEVADDRPAPSAGPGAVKVLVVGDLLGGVVGAGLLSPDRPAGSPPLAVWNTADLGCAFSSPGRPIGPDGPLEVAEYCRHWPERWRAAIREFDPDVVVWANGLWDSLPWEVDGRRLDAAADRRRLADLADRQLSALGQLAGSSRSVVAVSVPDVSAISPPDQVDDGARSARSRMLAATLDAAGDRGDGRFRVVPAPGAPDATELQRLGATEVAQAVVASASP